MATTQFDDAGVLIIEPSNFWGAEIQQSHPDTCACITCIQHELGYFSKLGDDSTSQMVLVDPDLSDAEPTASPPSTPSTGSTRSKRACLSSDEEDPNSDSEPDQKRARTSSITSSRRPYLNDDHLRLPRIGDDFVDFFDRPGTAFVDKTECILQLPDKFRYLLLRPPRFGKTTLLSTLNQFYDIHRAKQFIKHFGSLAVLTKAPATIPQHNHHLCLSFNLSDLRFYDVADIRSELAGEISLVLRKFLTKYAKELQLPYPNMFLRQEKSIKFARVFELVRACGYTLFVGVDDYDAPTRMRSFAHLDYPESHTTFASSHEIERLLDSCFWRPLLAGSDVIDKLFIAGTLSLKYPALEGQMLNPGAVPGLQASCGFTEQEALKFAQSLLDEVPDMTDLRRSCGNYVFALQDARRDIAEPVLHPQCLIARISQLSSLKRPRADADPFDLLSNLFKLLPEESDVPGAATSNGLIDLLATGAVEINEIDAALGFDATAVTWNALYHAGALTYDRQLEGTLRLANSAALSLIHSHVDTLLSKRHDFGHRFLNSWYNYDMLDEPQAFLTLLSEVLCDQALRSLGRKREPNLRGIFELLFRNAHTQYGPTVEPIVLLPVDVTRIELPTYLRNGVHVWDIKTLTLLGMWQATNLNDDEPTLEALRTLHQALIDDDEEHLLARPYRVWSPTLNAMETVSVSSFFDPEPEPTQFLAVGGARILTRRRTAAKKSD
ncbi:hypothetical protein C8R44DRAFT_866960 [Mycena epipterygia]|nr:hypothetical protein C8R44DRAFT_866960 [Mycena epipterygia]